MGSKSKQWPMSCCILFSIFFCCLLSFFFIPVAVGYLRPLFKYGFYLFIQIIGFKWPFLLVFIYYYFFFYLGMIGCMLSDKSLFEIGYITEWKKDGKRRGEKRREEERKALNNYCNLIHVCLFSFVSI